MSMTNDTTRLGEPTLREMVEPLQAELLAVLDRFALPDDGPTQAIAFAKIYANAEVFGTQLRTVIEHDDHPDAARTRCLGILRDLALYISTCGTSSIN